MFNDKFDNVSNEYIAFYKKKKENCMSNNTEKYSSEPYIYVSGM
jgi:hypothetical protein